jgi:alkylation response protein AidB-like acyl-CoA dehydrogenase
LWLETIDMHLAPTAEQQALKDAVRRFCQERITPERLAAWQQEARGIDAAGWAAIAGLGWFGLGLPTAAGGSGLGLVEVACLLAECGRGLVPHAVINAIRSAVALATLDPTSRFLAGLAVGEHTVTLALDEARVRDPKAYAARVRMDGGRPLLHGEKWYVADARQAHVHVVAAHWDEDLALVLVEGAGTRTTPLRTFDGERQAVVAYDGTPVLQRLSLPGAGAASLAVLRRQRVALALAEIVGGMEAALDMTVAYVKEREQFGQKIAVFQAVQHQVADMAMLLTASRHLSWQAITRLAAGTEQGTELSMAAAFAGQAFKRVTLTAHHLHGGAGYVVEHPLHYYAERAQSLCVRYTPEAAALAEVAASLLDTR